MVLCHWVYFFFKASHWPSCRMIDDSQTKGLTRNVYLPFSYIMNTWLFLLHHYLFWQFNPPKFLGLYVYIGLCDMGAKRRLNSISIVNRRTHKRTHKRTFRLIERIGQEGRFFENQLAIDSRHLDLYRTNAFQVCIGFSRQAAILSHQGDISERAGVLVLPENLWQKTDLVLLEVWM